VDIGKVQGLVPVLSLGDDGQSRVGFEQSAKANAEHWMIVDDHDPALEHGGVSFKSSTF
jgi:hypothetical protein